MSPPSRRRRSLWAEKKRDRDLRDVGLGVSHIVYEDFWAPRRARGHPSGLKREYADTVAMFGAVLPAHLVRQAPSCAVIVAVAGPERRPQDM